MAASRQTAAIRMTWLTGLNHIGVIPKDPHFSPETPARSASEGTNYD